MALSTVTLKWNVTDLIQGGQTATLIITPTAQMADSTDHVLVAQPVPRRIVFSGGQGQLAGIVANDNANILPAGSGYTIEMVTTSGLGTSGAVIIPAFTTQLLFSNGAIQWLDALAPVASVTTQFQYLPLPSGSPVAGDVPVVTSSGSEATTWQPVSGSSAVSSVFGRTGAVVATTGDYTATQVGADASGAAAAAQAASLQKTSNLSDVASASTARTNLGLGSAATLASAAVAQTANNLSDLASAASARTNLSLGSSALLNVTPWFTNKSGAYVQGQTSVATSALLTNQLLRLTPVIITSSLTITQLGAELTAAGEANSLIRLAMYADDGTGYPGSLLVDAGSISTGTGNAGNVATGGTPGVYMITLGTPLALTPGLYWLGGAVQGAPTTPPTMRTGSFGNQFAGGPSAVPGTSAAQLGYTQSSVSGAMPGTFNAFSSAGAAGTVPRIIFKIQ